MSPSQSAASVNEFLITAALKDRIDDIGKALEYTTVVALVTKTAASFRLDSRADLALTAYLKAIKVYRDIVKVARDPARLEGLQWKYDSVRKARATLQRLINTSESIKGLDAELETFESNFYPGQGYGKGTGVACVIIYGARLALIARHISGELSTVRDHPQQWKIAQNVEEVPQAIRTFTAPSSGSPAQVVKNSRSSGPLPAQIPRKKAPSASVARQSAPSTGGSGQLQVERRVTFKEGTQSPVSGASRRTNNIPATTGKASRQADNRGPPRR